jgi:hypothetical protein
MGIDTEPFFVEIWRTFMISGMRGISTPTRKTALCLVGIACAVLLSWAAAISGAAPANAKPEFAAQTKLACGQCHTNATGGGKLKPLGEKFKANGNKLK